MYSELLATQLPISRVTGKVPQSTGDSVYNLTMSDELEAIFERLHRTLDFADADFSDVNAASTDGDNALHCVVRWGDLAAAKALIAGGIDVNKAGDLGYTPLHVACMQERRNGQAPGC
jgi:ankyrin repeat protein